MCPCLFSAQMNLFQKEVAELDHVKVSIRGMGRFPYVKDTCIHGVYISQNNRPIHIRHESDIQESGTLASISAENTRM